jgi:hypothetical protein
VVAKSQKEAIREAEITFKCPANDYEFGDILEEKKITKIEAEVAPH